MTLVYLSAREAPAPWRHCAVYNKTSTRKQHVNKPNWYRSLRSRKFRVNSSGNLDKYLRQQRNFPFGKVLASRVVRSLQGCVGLRAQAHSSSDPGRQPDSGVRGVMYAWGKGSSGLLPHPVSSHWLHPDLSFILKKSHSHGLLSKGSGRVHDVHVSINVR